MRINEEKDDEKGEETGKGKMEKETGKGRK